ncbi:ComF family protein [Dethiosulfovibrio salsuginis]|uniref:Predicted amidophosphoribosyltransferases n=1 Tax=Dethiosulfovibrio salsuginis TaxID=561720 RepID=A0A1X7IW25_9BACT|nr:phosphoribosyltransferase family protein [Dethiosulfovibrio salsuginis]SMG18756.1 Predicted amidophosphoribosyltransferases [Dethiosulfovibrio salsuginis]
MLKYLLHLIWPSACPVCGAIGEDLCPSCCSELIVPSGPVCLLCEGSLPCPTHGNLEWYSAAPHGGMARELVLSLKYQGNGAIGLEMGIQMASVFPKPEHAAIIPVPLHRGSPRKYNQARWIVAGISKVWGFPIVDKLRWNKTLSCQTSLDGSGRTEMPENALRWDGPCLNGREAVIVDDVKTTGTTLYRAYRALGEARPDRVRFITWSRSVVEKKGGISFGT